MRGQEPPKSEMWPCSPGKDAAHSGPSWNPERVVGGSPPNAASPALAPQPASTLAGQGGSPEGLSRPPWHPYHILQVRG